MHARSIAFYSLCLQGTNLHRTDRRIQRLIGENLLGLKSLVLQ
jgi:hypothetical protein